MTDSTIWERIAAPLDKKQIKARSQGKATIRYISRDAVIYRLNQVCPGEWEFRVEMISTPATGGWVAKGTLTIQGVTREDFGVPDNADYFDPPKAAASDALKRCASQFGFALELYGDEPMTPSVSKSPASAPAEEPQEPLTAHFGPRQNGQDDDLSDIGSSAMCRLDGADIARVVKHSIKTAGTKHEKHWNNRYAAHFPGQKRNELLITVGEFLDKMETPSSKPEAEAA